MTARVTHLVCSLALLALCAPRVQAQLVVGGVAPVSPVVRHRWHDKVSVSAHLDILAPRRKSELYWLLDDALAPGAGAVRPRLVGLDVHYRMSERWSAIVGGQSGGSGTISSTSVVPPSGASGGVAQRTSLALSSMSYAGAELRAYRWPGTSPQVQDRLQVQVNGGMGVARYALRQWGSFVDVPLTEAYSADYRSHGAGAFTFLGTSVTVPVRQSIAVLLQVRRLFGSAPMSDDYSTFDRLDLGGTQFGLGVRLGRQF